jgi:RNA polymerase sigma-70 factor (ECF subfamily)
MDEDGLQLAQRGDKEAINQLIVAYQQSVFNLCYRMLGETTEAEDATQKLWSRRY